MPTGRRARAWLTLARGFETLRQCGLASVAPHNNYPHFSA